MPVFRRLFAVILLAVLAGFTLAQSINHNEAIPECTPEQAYQAVIFMDLIVNTELGIIREQEQRSDYPFYQFDNYMKIWRNYDDDYRQRMPQCALVLRFESALYRLVGSQAFLNGANMMIEETGKDDFLRLREVPPIVESAVEEFDTVFQELTALAEQAEQYK